MTEGAAHLSDSARAALDLSEARIERVRRPRWIGYTRAKQLLDTLEDLFTHPKTHRMPSPSWWGKRTLSKTMIANRFVQLHPACDRPDGEAALVLSWPFRPHLDRMRVDCTTASLRRCSPYHPRERVTHKQFQVLRLLKRVDVRLFIIDEMHNILTGPVSKQRQFLNVLKYLSNDLQISLVGLGTQEACAPFRPIRSLPIASRLCPCRAGVWTKEFLRLLSSFERTLPLRHASRLIEERVARKLSR